MADLDDAREFVRSGDFESIEVLYGSVQDTLSQLVRTAFVADSSSTFAVVDYSAIEARVIAWLSGERWRMDVFSTHGKIYEASASAMFGVPIESVTKGSELRKKGKIAELALGYGGSVGALKVMGASKMGLDDDELTALVASWRKANPRIVSLWRTLQKCAMAVVSDGRMQSDAPLPRGMRMKKRDGDLVVTLPSGREMCYVGARIDVGKKFGNPTLTYMGRSSGVRFERLETYGGKLAENVVQAIARDVLAWAMLRLESAGYPIVMHIHDEVVVEVEEAHADRHLERIRRIMCEDVSWTEELKLAADGYTTKYYLKD
jgi:DNA polymerase